MTEKTMTMRGCRGQAILEFAFCMVVVFLMAYALVMIFKWTAQDLISRDSAHTSGLTGNISESYGAPSQGPLKQISPYFYYGTDMKGVVGE